MNYLTNHPQTTDIDKFKSLVRHICHTKISIKNINLKIWYTMYQTSSALRKMFLDELAKYCNSGEDFEFTLALQKAFVKHK